MLLSLILLTFATFYVTYAVTRSNGPFNVFQGARDKLPHGGLLLCHTCLALWVSLVLFVCVFRDVDIVAILAIAGASEVVDRYVDG